MKMAKQLRKIVASYAVVTENLINEVLNGEYENPADRIFAKTLNY